MAVHVVINSKGGVGKSTVSNHLLSAYLYVKNNAEKVKFYEIDDENKSVLRFKDSDVLDAALISTEMIDSFIEDTFYDTTDLIIDVGGNITATTFLHHLEEFGGFAAQAIYYIPLLDSDQDAANAERTYCRIREFDTKSKIVFVLNRCTNRDNKELVRREFMDFFGEDVLDVPGVPRDENTYVLMINSSHIYRLAGRLGKTVLELSKEDYEEAKNEISIERWNNKDNPLIEKEASLILFLLKQSNIAKRLINGEYKSLFKELDKILEEI